ncbi:selenium metabolism-associated LysR family transcriptional regulator [Desulfosediminicola ganghwensis]|uniref:selenium metabolism-associated LysR family transcriptional regulator n=1 Tax=Desulfosediminicola ganghwensis TaxID=2569540 RepID=UPI001E588CFB|nr:selenium metabolism-associated LysR family transcriptional regulator [Desulfosediminicola ganghwensis]
METRHLRIFTSVYQTRSFTKAAEMLHTSQPTVSEHIRNLEMHLDCRLFDRLGRSIMPTREAEILYPRALAILQDMQKLEEEIAMAGQTVSGELIIGASTIPGAYVLPSIASTFKETYPGISFEVRIDDSAKIVQAILANDLFLGIVGARIPARKITYLPFTQDELILVCSAKRDIPDKIAPEYLLELPFIFREHGSGTRKNIENFLAEQKINTDQLDIVAMLGSSTAVKEAVKADLGVSIISRHALQDELKAGTVREIEIHGLTMLRSFYIATASKRTLPHHYQAFLDSLLTMVSKE